ncbi:MAG: PQQ-binding-like beta-propeller repeat protein [Firmicutes bacterium]|nr:PQQ-binding-like beta-propeller repeat protein [Bacillota bacterium]
MRRYKRFVGVLLALTLLATVIAPALAGTMTIVPDKEAYTGGETVSVTAATYEGDHRITGGIKWHRQDREGKKHLLPGDGDTIEFTVPENNSGQTVTSVVYAVYNGREHWLHLNIEPGLGENAALSINAGKTTIVEQETALLSAQVADGNGDPVPGAVINWASSAPGVARVDEDGYVTGITPGTAIITASLQFSPNVKDQIEITVAAGQLPSLEILALNPPGGASSVTLDTEFNLVFNQPVELNNTKPQVGLAYDRDYGGEPNVYLPYFNDVFEVSANVPNKVIVNINDSLEQNHVYKFMLNKSIKQKYGNKQFAGLWGNEWIFDTKSAGPVPNILSINDKTTQRLHVNTTLQMTATVKDAGGEIIDLPVNWETDNPAMATVDENGVVTGQSPGIVTIRAEADGWPHIEDRHKIEVRQNFTRQLMPKWTYTMPRADAKHIGHPAAGADGSTYAMIRETDDDFIILALNPGGGIKESFVSPLVTMPPVVGAADEREYLFTAMDDTFLALDPHTGAVLWQVRLDAKIGTMAAAGQEGSIFVGCEDGRLYAVNSEMKDEYLWRFNTRDHILNCLPGPWHGRASDSIPTVDQEGNVYVASGHTLWVVDGSTGTLRWKFETPEKECIHCQAAVGSDGTVYIYDKAVNKDTIYALTPPATPGGTAVVEWSESYDNVDINTPVVDTDGGVYFEIEHKFVKLEPDTGEIIRQYPFTTNYARVGADGFLYTNRAIYDRNREPIAYYDDYRNNLPYFGYSRFDLGDDGTLYRSLINEGHCVGIEAMRLYDLSDSVISGLKVYEEQIVLYPGETRRLKAEVLDQNGAALPAVELQWTSSDPAVAAVSADGLVTAGDIGDTLEKETIVTVKVKEKPEISKGIAVKVLKPQIPHKMYFVFDSTSNDPEQQQRAEKITAYNGEGFRPVRVFIEDLNGKFVPKQPVEWELANAGLVDMLNYQGGSGDYSIRYNANLTGKEAGTTTLTASLANYPDIKCSLEIEVLPAPYQVLWSIPLDGRWGQRNAHHVLGTDGQIFYVNDNRLRAVRQNDGAALWNSDPGDYLGIQLSPPQVDETGTIYLHGTGSTVVVALSPEDGAIEWNFIRGADPVTDLQIGPDALYAPTRGGKLYKLDKDDGKPLWEAPLNIGASIDGLVVSQTGKLYLSQSGAVYEIDADGEKNLLYSESDSRLYLEEVTVAGDIIVQRRQAGQFSLLSLDAGGGVNWTYAGLKGEVVLSCDQAGAVYAISAPSEYHEKDLYFLHPDGAAKAETTLSTDEWVRTPAGIYKPAIGRDGQVYIATCGIFVVDGQTGGLLWSARIKDQFGRQFPQSITVNQDGVVGVTVGEMGLMALKGLNQTASAGLNLNVGGGENLRPDSLRDLKLTVTNNQTAGQDILLLISLYDEQLNRIVSYASFADRLAAGDEDTYTGGVNIPDRGSYRVHVQVLDGAAPDKKPLRQVILPVKP